MPKPIRSVATFVLLLSSSGIAANFQFGHQTITVPDGFVVERVADAPLTERPITADFDELGRLYVAESSGSNDPVDQQLKDKPHSILRLEDTDGDGKFDRRTVFADKMMFPAGTLWHDGSLYVTAPPEIWKLTDTDDDGVADQREVWFNPGTLTGCANDLHGPYLGLDGWIYWCKGAFAKQELTLTTGEPFVTRAAHIFRRRADGGGVEPVMTGGMDNPVEVAFGPGGERFFSSTFIQHPGGGKRDGIIHAIYGGTYGKIHNVIDEHPRTGDVLPALVQLGPAAACALMRYESGAFGDAYRNNLFSSSFNLHKITRHQLVPDGSTFKTVDEDFVTSTDPDFHPTHITEDADGSLLVIDTGGWYKLCCPTSQLYKPDVLGAIYRVRRSDAKQLNDARGLKLDWKNATSADLAKRLEDPRVFVRRRAIETLARLGATQELAKLRASSPNSDARLAAVWSLTRIDGPDARAAVVKALDDSDGTVQQAALHSIALWRDGNASKQLLTILKNGTPHHRRVAAEALGRIGDAATVPALLESAATPVDRILEHSITYALIEIGKPLPVLDGLESENPHTRRVALIALDQMPGNRLDPEKVVRLLSSPDPLLRETANWIVDRHDDWGAALAGFFRDQLNNKTISGEERALVAGQMAKFISDETIRSLIAEGLASPSPSAREICLRAVADSRIKQIPDAWISTLEKLLTTPGDQLDLTLTSLGSLELKQDNIANLIGRLQGIARNENNAAPLRLKALAAIPSNDLKLSAGLFEFLISRLASDQPVAIRSSAAATLERAQLTRAQLTQLTDALRTAGPLEVRRLLAAYENQTDEELGLQLVDALTGSTAKHSLRKEIVQPSIAKFPATVQSQADALYAALNENAGKQKERLDQLMTTLDGGDIRRGQALFNSEKTACSTCHSIGYLGGQIGPDLTTIGTVRTARDLLEAIVYPSASFVRSYEPITVATRNELEYSGILKEDAPDEIVLLTGIGTETRIARADIADMAPGTVSIMPDGLTENLSQQELADLLAFLKATKWK